ncbi:MAG: fimbrillin family protein [Bacteroidales bacterium]|nr:fimbrillin family protein [Bacteroidales bacterium]
MKAKEVLTKVSRFLAMTNSKKAWLCSFGLTKTLLFFFLISVIFSSCEGDTPTPGSLGKEVQLSASIEGLKTRASGSAWDKGDAIGVYMKKAGEALSSTAFAKNIHYQTTGTSAFLPVKGEEIITFPVDGSNVDFIGYYPYREDITSFIYPIDLSNQAVQANIDLLYSDNVKSSNSGTPNINMLFSHQLSKIVLQIGHEFLPTLSDMEVIITNVATKANFDLKEGTLSAPSATEDISCMVVANGLTAEAILLPTSDLSGMEFWFVLKKETFKYPLSSVSEIQSFNKSTRYTYNIHLDSDLIPTVTAGDISDWNEGPSGNAIVPSTEESPPRIPGSKRTPYTVAEAQEQQGKAGVWVEGYIVGYFSSSTMNSFSTDLSGDVSQSNLALATTQGEDDLSRIMPVMLGSGSIRDKLNLKANPGNFNKKVKITGELDNYLSAPGLRDIKAFEFTETE